jgi:hypothetical protein
MLYSKSIKSSKKVANQYICNLCEYMSSKKISYDRHLSSKKHAKKYARSNIQCNNNITLL